MIDQAGLGVNSVKARLVDWILGWASLFIYFFINLRGLPTTSSIQGACF